ncbi:MAG: nucleotidyltransferase domain-containing protein [Saprospiraceae bacterium]
MLTRKTLAEVIIGVYEELSHLGYKPDRMILFGSYAKGGVHQYSDVDIAVWNSGFSGEGLIDLEKIRPVLRKFRGVDLKMYPSGATAENFDPFIDVIEKTGEEILLEKESM